MTLKEPGLYKLILRSDKPEAEAFQDWVFEEILPQIRRTGSYAHGQGGFNLVSLLTDLLGELRRIRAERDELRGAFMAVLAANRLIGGMAGRQLRARRDQVQSERTMERAIQEFPLFRILEEALDGRAGLALN